MARSPRDSRFPEPAPYRQEPLSVERSELVREGWPEALERREACRRASGLPVQILWRGERIPASLGDLSRSGMSLRTEAPLPLGEKVRIELEGNASLAWGCSVVHRRPVSRSLTGIGTGSVGLALYELSPTLELLLRD